MFKKIFNKLMGPDGSFKLRAVPARSDAFILVLKDALDEKTPGLDRLLETEIAQAVENGCKLLVVSCKNLMFIDYACLSAVLCQWLRLRSRGGDVVFCHLSKEMYLFLTERFDLLLNFDPHGANLGCSDHGEREVTLPLFRNEAEALAFPLTEAKPSDWWFWKWDTHLLVETEIVDDTTVVSLKGALWGTRDEELLVHQIEFIQTSKIVLDMTNLITLNPDMMNTFFKLKKSGKEVVWVGLGMLTAVLMTGFGGLFPHHSTRAAALSKSDPSGSLTPFEPFTDFGIGPEEYNLLRTLRDTDRTRNLTARRDFFNRHPAKPQSSMRHIERHVENLARLGHSCCWIQDAVPLGQTFVYSIGFYYTYGFPELMLLAPAGTEPQLLQHLLNKISEPWERDSSEPSKHLLQTRVNQMAESLKLAMKDIGIEIRSMGWVGPEFLENYAYGLGDYFYAHFLDTIDIPLLRANVQKA